MRQIFLIAFAGGYLRLVVMLVRVGAPSWLVNTPQILLHALVPDSFRLAAFDAWMLREEAQGRGFSHE